MRRIAGVLAAGSVVGVLFGLVNLGGVVQIGGGEGMILRGGPVVIGSLALGAGALLFLGSYEPGGGFRNRAVLGGIALMVIAGAILIALGETPEDFCGQPRCQ